MIQTKRIYKCKECGCTEEHETFEKEDVGYRKCPQCGREVEYYRVTRTQTPGYTLTGYNAPDVIEN